MQLFGITLNRFSIPIIYLACAIVGFLLIRESIHMLRHPIATRGISVWLELGFIILSLPAIRKENIPLPRQAYSLLLVWLCWTLTSTLLGEQPWPAMVRWFEILSSIITAFCLYVLISRQPNLITIIIKAIAAAVLLCILSLIVFWNISPNPIKHNWASTLPFFINIRHLGYLAVVAVPIGYWLLDKYSVHNKNSYKNTGYIICYLISSWALVFWLGGRGTFLAVTIITVIYTFITLKKNIKWTILSPLIGLLLSQFFIVDNPSLNLFRLIGQEGVTLNAFTSFREVIYQESIIYWWQNSPLLGIGADGYRYLIPAIGNVESIAHPHSSIIQLLLSYGPVGLLIPTYFFFLLTWKIIKPGKSCLNKTNNFAKTIYLILLATLILSLFDGILYHAYGLFISAIVAGICIALAWPQQTNTPVESSLYERKNHTTTKRNQTGNWITAAIIISVVSTSVYYAVFTHQLYHSKYGIKTKEWINWNAHYPLYFSPTWTYERYNTDNIELLKQRYIERINANEQK